jgi:serine/threonine protein kinase
MDLIPGERLPGVGTAQQPGGYVVSTLVAQTPFAALYTGKKILHNFDFTNKRVREADEAEWIEVLLRTIRYPFLDDPGYVVQRRNLARREVRRVLGHRAHPMWPQALDLMELPARDSFVVPVDEDSEPVVVFARPHGTPLTAWQESVLPLAALLGVLAELLDFLRQAHADGLLLQALSPAAILVDRADRCHYLGTDTVIEATHDEVSADQRARHFPADRFPLGFTAPENLEPETRPDARGDLYAWGAVAYYLLTGQSPADIALARGQPWARFSETHFRRLERSLRELPARHVNDWTEQLGLEPDTLTDDWPGNIVQLFRALLHPDRSRRPGTVEELLMWARTPPPAPPVAALALITSPGEAHVFLDWDVTRGLEMVICRGVAQPPQSPTEGTRLVGGPASSSAVDPDVPLTPAPVYYTVFARRGHVYAEGTTVELEEASPAAFLRLANREAALADDGPPPAIALLFKVRDKLPLVEALSRSPLAVVRGWALTELEQLFQAQPGSIQAEDALWHWLRDSDPALRRRAAAALLTRPRDVDTLAHMARFAGQGDLDVCLLLVDAFIGAGLDRSLADRVRNMLEESGP